MLQRRQQRNKNRTNLFSVVPTMPTMILGPRPPYMRSESAAGCSRWTKPSGTALELMLAKDPSELLIRSNGGEGAR